MKECMYLIDGAPSPISNCRPNWMNWLSSPTQIRSLCMSSAGSREFAPFPLLVLSHFLNSGPSVLLMFKTQTSDVFGESHWKEAHLLSGSHHGSSWRRKARWINHFDLLYYSKSLLSWKYHMGLLVCGAVRHNVKSRVGYFAQKCLRQLWDDLLFIFEKIYNWTCCIHILILISPVEDNCQTLTKLILHYIYLADAFIQSDSQ